MHIQTKTKILIFWGTILTWFVMGLSAHVFNRISQLLGFGALDESPQAVKLILFIIIFFAEMFGGAFFFYRLQVKMARKHSESLNGKADFQSEFWERFFTTCKLIILFGFLAICGCVIIITIVACVKALT